MHIHRAPQDSAVSRARELKAACEKLARHCATWNVTAALDRAALGAQASQRILAVARSVTLARIDLPPPRKDQEYFIIGSVSTKSSVFQRRAGIFSINLIRRSAYSHGVKAKFGQRDKADRVAASRRVLLFQTATTPRGVSHGHQPTRTIG